MGLAGLHDVCVAIGPIQLNWRIVCDQIYLVHSYLPVLKIINIYQAKFIQTNGFLYCIACGNYAFSTNIFLRSTMLIFGSSKMC